MEYAWILLAALLLDAVFGEPAWLWSRAPHPRALLIDVCNFLGEAMQGRYEPRLPGGMALALVAIIAAAVGWLLSAVSLFGVVEALAAAILIGFRDVLDRLRGVERGLAIGAEESAQALSRIARRHMAPMSPDMTSRLAAEMTATHFTDRVIAPVFWFLFFGLPGMCIVYAVDVARQVFAPDPAEGEGFGWAALRLDELIKWIPGRIAGGVLVIAALPKNAWEVMRDDFAIHRSAYAGWPIAAAAGALGIALGGPRPDEEERTGAEPYINRNGKRELDGADLGRLAGLLWRGWLVTMIILAILASPALLL